MGKSHDLATMASDGFAFTGAVTHSGNVSGATTFTDAVTFQKNINVGNNTNLLSNGEFTTNTTGWTATGSTLAIVSNELQLTPGSGVNGFANQQVDNLVVGRSYIASVTVTVDAGSLTRLYIGTSANGNQTLSNINLGTGTHSFPFTATATTHHFALVVGGGTGQVTRFDNAKLVEASRIEFPAASGTAPVIRQGASVNDLSIATNNINRLNVDNSGRVTKPSQPSFLAYRAGANYTTTNAAWEKVLLDGTRWNTGSHFDTTNNRFIAPVDGVYHFDGGVNRYSLPVGTIFRVALRVNGSDYIFGQVDYSDSTGDLKYLVSSTVKLDANDYVELWSYVNTTNSNGFSSGTAWNTLSGHLVS